MLFLGNATAMSGIFHYFNDVVKTTSTGMLGLVSLLTFCLLVLVCEFFYRRANYISDLKLPQNLVSDEVSNRKFMTYSVEQIDKGVAAGMPLLIFDNLVLNLNGYDVLHPGGRFVLRHNFGRDISKFFNGGYSLIQGKGVTPHQHSAHALEILKSLIVGVVNHQQGVREEVYRICNKERVTESTYTFTFKQVECRSVHNLRRWYSDLAQMGRHFLVSSVRHPKIKRHYTICSSMRPELLQELLKLAHDFLNGNQIEFKMSLLDSRNQDKICLTLKNYKMPRGVSTQVHSVVPVLDPPEEEELNVTIGEE